MKGEYKIARMLPINGQKVPWIAGPWDHEPDRLEWRSREFPCLIVRQDQGHLCGYVGLPPHHPWYNKGRDEIPAYTYGGITFAELCEPDSPPICHEPLPGESANVFWIGFDCDHAGRDLNPTILTLSDFFEDKVAFGKATYKNIAFVKEIVENLVDQAEKALRSQ